MSSFMSSNMVVRNIAKLQRWSNYSSFGRRSELFEWLYSSVSISDNNMEKFVSESSFTLLFDLIRQLVPFYVGFYDNITHTSCAWADDFNVR